MRGANLGVVQEAEEWADGGDAGRYDREVEFETGILLTD